MNSDAMSSKGFDLRWGVEGSACADERNRASELIESSLHGHRLSETEALEILENGDQQQILEAGDKRRQQLHPDGLVGYIVDRNVNYSNVCTSNCAFCAFYRRPGHAEAYVLPHEEIHAKVDECLQLGGSGILMQGGLHPELGLDWYTSLFQSLKTKFPEVYLHCLSPTEIHGLHQVTKMPVEDILKELKAAGLDSIPGGGGEILVDEVRKRRRSSCSSQEWLDISATAHRVGLPTTATMMFGMGEKASFRIEHLAKVRKLQDETQGFISFIPWNFQPDNTPLGKAIPNRVPTDYYLRLLALSRLFLDNIKNLQVSWLTQGIPGGIQGLQCGANDIGSIMIEENVISQAGANHEASERMLQNAIHEAGFKHALRNGGYHRLPNRPIPPAIKIGT